MYRILIGTDELQQHDVCIDAVYGDFLKIMTSDVCEQVNWLTTFKWRQKYFFPTSMTW